jgi:hypothetical protein
MWPLLAELVGRHAGWLDIAIMYEPGRPRRLCTSSRSGRLTSLPRIGIDTPIRVTGDLIERGYFR